MNAQERWKHYYRQIVEGMIVPEYIPEQRADMKHFRREAALERIIARLQRENAEQKKDIDGLNECVEVAYYERDKYILVIEAMQVKP